MSASPMNLTGLESQYGLPTGLLSAVMQTESGGDPAAVSPKGATGAFQFMPETAKQYGIDPNNPAQAAQGAAQYISDLRDKYGDLPTALAAYNWGPGNVDKKGLEKAPDETKNYVQKVMGAVGNAIVPSAQAAESSSGLPPGFEIEQQTSQTAQALPPGFEIETQPSEKPLPTGTAALGPELKTAATNAGEMSASGFNDAMEAVTPVTALAKMAMGKPLSPEEGEYLDQDSVSGALSPGWDALKALGKGIAGGAGMVFSPLSAANRAFAGNPIQNATGVPSGATDFAMSLAEPWALGKSLGALGSLSKLLPAGEASDGGSALAKMSSMMNGAPETEAPATIAEAQKVAAPEVTGSTKPDVAAPETSIPVSAGQASQMPELQRFEADAVAGAKGPAAQSEALDFNARQQQAVLEMLQNIGEYKAGGNPADSVGSVAKLIKANEGAASDEVDQAYKTARQLGQNVQIGKSDMTDNLKPVIDQIAEERTIDAGRTPGANALYGRLQKLMDTQDGQLSPMLQKMEGWRSAATQAASDTSNPADAGAIRKMIGAYDGYMGNLSERLSGAGDQGSADAIGAFKNAVATRASYGDKFQGNPLVESLVSGDKSIDDVTENLLGKGVVGNRQGMLDNLNGILRASGEQAPLVKAQLQSAYSQRIYDTVAGSKIAGTTTDSLSLPKLQTALENTFVKNREFATGLFGPDAVSNAQEAIKTLDLINSRQANVGNASNSGYTLNRLAGTAAGWLSHVPGLKHVVNGLSAMANASKEGQAAKEAAATFSGDIPKSFQPPGPPSSVPFGGPALAAVNAINQSQ